MRDKYDWAGKPSTDSVEVMRQYDGTELRRVGFETLHGTDISEASLEQSASKGVYRSLVRANLLEPLPISHDTFDAAICIGVLSYISADGLFRELCRVIRKGGILLLSHRTDLIVERSFGELLTDLDAQGLWSSEFQSANLPYLPGHPDFGTRIEVQLFVLRVR